MEIQFDFQDIAQEIDQAMQALLANQKIYTLVRHNQVYFLMKRPENSSKFTGTGQFELKDGSLAGSKILGLQFRSSL